MGTVDLCNTNVQNKFKIQEDMIITTQMLQNKVKIKKHK